MNRIDQLMQKDYTYTQFAYNTGGSTIDDNVVSLTEERDELLGILATIDSEMNAYLPNKLATNGLVYWNTTDGTIKGYKFTVVLNGGITYIDPSTFSCVGDQTLSFALTGSVLISPAPTGNVTTFPLADGALICDCGVDGLRYCLLGSSTYDGMGTTTVSLSGGSITSHITKVSLFNGTYYNRTTNWDSDTYVSQREDEWAFTYDHLYKPLGTGGCYGVVARLAAATASSGLMSANKAKNDQFAPVYQRFTAWTKVLDNTNPALPDVAYDGMLSFTCDGNLTTSLPVSANILMDCDTDGMKGGVIDTSTYFPPSAGSYTEVVLTPDLEKNAEDGILAMYITENIERVLSWANIPILDNTDPAKDDVVYENIITFRCPNDHRTSFGAGYTVKCDCGLDGILNFTVTSSTYVTGRGDYTKIEYLEGLPITNNITCVSINTT